MGFVYFISNLLFHAIHLSFIVFYLVGWLFSETLWLHLTATGVMLGCWYGLASIFGPGFCPLTHFHWKLKERFGVKPATGIYIKYMLDKLSPKLIDEARVDRITLQVTFGILVGALLHAIVRVVS